MQWYSLNIHALKKLLKFKKYKVLKLYAFQSFKCTHFFSCVKEKQVKVLTKSGPNFQI